MLISNHPWETPRARIGWRMAIFLQAHFCWSVSSKVAECWGQRAKQYLRKGFSGETALEKAKLPYQGAENRYPILSIGTSLAVHPTGKRKGTSWPLPSATCISVHTCFIYSGVDSILSQNGSLGPLQFLNVITTSPRKNHLQLIFTLKFANIAHTLPASPSLFRLKQSKPTLLFLSLYRCDDHSLQECGPLVHSMRSTESAQTHSTPLVFRWSRRAFKVPQRSWGAWSCILPYVCMSCSPAPNLHSLLSFPLPCFSYGPQPRSFRNISLSLTLLCCKGTRQQQGYNSWHLLLGSLTPLSTLSVTGSGVPKTTLRASH